MEIDHIDTKVKSTAIQVVKYVSTGGKNVEKFGPERDYKKSDTLFLRFAVITGILLLLEGAAASVWTSPAVVKLQSNDTNSNPLGRPITTMEISYLVGIPGIVSLVGAGFLPKLSDLIGRKRSLQVMGFGMFFSIVGLGFSKQIILITAFSSLIQIFGAGIWGILPIYITEICEDHNRAKYGCIMTLFSPIGQLYSFTIGSVFSLRNYTLLLTVPLIPFLLLFFVAPESPVYSLSKGNDNECITALKKLRSNKLDKEIEYDLNTINESLTIDKNIGTKKIMKLFCKKEGKVGLILAMLPILGQNFSGVPIVMALLAPIFNESGSNLSGDTIAIIVGVVKVSTFMFTSLIIERTGRKSMLIISATGAGICISTLGIFFYLKEIHSPIVLQFQWVPLACVLVYIIFYAIGLGPIPMTLMGELFAADIRSTGIAFISTTSTLVNSVYMFAYPILAAGIGTYYCLWIFGASCFLNALLFSVFLPETKGKSVVIIQKILLDYKFFK